MNEGPVPAPGGWLAGKSLFNARVYTRRRRQGTQNGFW